MRAVAMLLLANLVSLTTHSCSCMQRSARPHCTDITAPYRRVQYRLTSSCCRCIVHAQMFIASGSKQGASSQSSLPIRHMLRLVHWVYHGDARPAPQVLDYEH